MYDIDFINYCKKYVYENTNYTLEWVNNLTQKKLVAIYFSLKNQKERKRENEKINARRKSA